MLGVSLERLVHDLPTAELAILKSRAADDWLFIGASLLVDAATPDHRLVRGDTLR